jgi:hypothetical protein
VHRGDHRLLDRLEAADHRLHVADLGAERHPVVPALHVAGEHREVDAGGEDRPSP